MVVSLEEILQRLAEKTTDNTRQLRRAVAQRRNGMEDLYGVEFTHNGDANHPATFYVSVSPDLVYYERFAFKFIIQPYSSSVAGASLSGIEIGDTELTVGGGSGSQVISGTSTLDDASIGSLTPNPHTHTASGSGGGINYGIKTLSTTSENWEVHIHGVDITDYLIEQHDGEWIEGEGVYPTNRVDGREDFYDILDVASMMYAEGTEESKENAEKLLRPEFKKVEIFSDAPFSITAFLYLKYSHANR